MRNFRKPQSAAAVLKIIDPNEKLEAVDEIVTGYDLQLLPEGGHAVAGVFIKVGVALKNATGIGTNAEGKVLKNGTQIASVELDENGLGSFLWLPEKAGKYEVSFDLDGENYIESLPAVKDVGVTLATKEVEGYLIIELKTNQATIQSNIQNQLIVAINGNEKLKQFKIDIDKDKNLIPISLDSIQPGVNQISVFSKDGLQLSERLFFNYKNLKVENEGLAYVKLDLDSLVVDLTYKSVLDGTLSVSVLPSKSIAYVKDRHIAGKFEILPYVTGIVQNPAQYFQDPTGRIKYKLDNLLLCQGWKMYDWSNMVSINDDYKFDFENGLSAKVKIQKDDDKSFYLHPTRKTTGEIIDIKEGEKEFSITGYFPTTNEKFIISKRNKKGTSEPTSVYPIFLPNRFPSLNYSNPTSPLQLNNDVKDIALEPLKGGSEQLDSLYVKTYSNEKRNERIANMSRGIVDFFDDDDRTEYLDILQYLRTRGFNATQRNGEINISYYASRFTNIAPLLIIDGNRLLDYDFLLGFDMRFVDYIEIDKSGLGGSQSFAGTNSAPTIIIKTDPLLFPYKKENKSFSSYDVPLTFSFPTKFYRPQYYSYTSETFNKLGVMDWQGMIKLEDGKARFTTPYLGKSEILLTIEGMASDGTLIHEQKVVKIAKQI
jgi:hypothetical protein